MTELEVLTVLRLPQWPKSHCEAATKTDLEKMEMKLMAKQADITAQLSVTAQQVAKIGTETRTLLDRIDTLQKAIEAQDDASPELEKAAADLAAQVAIVDDLVPDAPDAQPIPAETALV